MSELPRLFGTKEPVAPDAAADLAQAVRALAEPTRVQLLSLVITHPHSTQRELVDALGRVNQSTVAHHLKRLMSAGLVTSRQDRACVRYTADRAGLRALSDALRPAGARRTVTAGIGGAA